MKELTAKLVGKGEPVSDLEDRIVEITQSEEQSEKNNFRKIRTFYGISGTTSGTLIFALLGSQKDKKEKQRGRKCA